MHSLVLYLCDMIVFIEYILPITYKIFKPNKLIKKKNGEQMECGDDGVRFCSDGWDKSRSS